MPRTARTISQSGYYHVLSRGTGKQIIFEDDEDHIFFLKILDKYRKEESSDIIAYCLMDNHFHILVRSDNLDRLMQKTGTTYAVYYNKKYDRTGHLFQNRFKSVPVETESSLLNVVRYIHNNPVKAGICSVDQYRWSSWEAYFGKKSLVQTDIVLSILGGRDGFLLYSKLDDTDPAESCLLDVDHTGRLTDEKAHRIIREKLNLESGTKIQSMSRQHRDMALRILKNEHLSIRQIERLTGLSRGIIQRA